VAEELWKGPMAGDTERPCDRKWKTLQRMARGAFAMEQSNFASQISSASLSASFIRPLELRSRFQQAATSAIIPESFPA
jgi:hypothetical protein